MWKILNSKTNNDLIIEVVFRLRLGNLAKIPVCKKKSSAFHWTAAYERSFSVMGPKLWNYIPYNLDSIQAGKNTVLEMCGIRDILTSCLTSAFQTSTLPPSALPPAA